MEYWMRTLHLTRSFCLRFLKSVLLVAAAAGLAGWWLLAPPTARGLSSTVVISQVYGGGGNSGAIYNSDFVELFNRGNTPVSLNGWSVQYASTTGTSWQKTDLTNVTLQPGQYYLLKQSGGATGGSLPTPDATGTIAMSASAGKVVLLNTNALLASGTNCPSGPTVVDIAGYGTGTNCFEGTGPTPSLSNPVAALRTNAGCTETDANSSDFITGTPSPRNTSSPLNPCGGPVNQPLTPTCLGTLATIEGTAASGNVSAVDADGTVTSAVITSITPSNPGTIALAGFTPAAATGGTARATLNVGATTPIGMYSVIITWSNNETPTPQTATCTVTVRVISSGPIPIHDIQGADETPNFAGQPVTIRGIVVGDFQGAANLNGFFVEEETSDWDADANTSEGIFVFAPSAPDVKVGDNVTVTGTVLNFNGATGLTELTSVSNVTVNSVNNPLPPAQTVTLPVPASLAADLEKYEGMLVSFGALTVTDNESLGQFGELGLSSGRLFIPTNSIDPNDNPAGGNSVSGNGNVAAVTAAQSLNNRNQIVLDDGRTGSYPNPIPFLGAGTGATVRLGDTVTNLTGVMSFGFGSYRVEPTAAVSITAANPRPAAPDAVGGSLKVASANLENWFFTLGTRGATNVAERNRQRDKLAAMLAGLNADVIGLSELEKGSATTPDAAINELIAKLNTLGVGTYAVVPTPAAVYDAANPVGTDTDIKSGLIYRTGTVTATGASLTDTAAAAGTYSRAPIAQTFQSKANGAKFSVVVNHLRSKACGGGSGEDNDQSTGQGCFNARRRSQAQALASFINSTLAPVDPDVIAIGDFNAYTQEDPMDVLRAAGLGDLLAASQYSFTFQSQVGRLDHAFATASFVSQITGATVWHINADEPDVFDYNTESKTDDRYAATPFRSADHDPVLVGLNLTCPAVSIEPASLPAGTAGAPYDQTLTAAGSVSGFTFTVTGGGLPDGLSLSTAGTISGSPTRTGTFPFTVTATAGAGCAGSREYSLTINCPVIAIKPDGIAGAFRGQPYSVAFSTMGGVGNVTLSFSGPRPQGLSFNAAANTLAGTPTQTGNFPFTITATDANGCTSSREFVLAVNTATMKLTDPAVCLGPGGVVAVEATVTNAGAVAQPASFTAVLPPGLLALSGTCTANVGTCTVTGGSTVQWNGTLAGPQTVSIRYNAQIADGTPMGTQFCISSNATVGASAPAGVSACTTVTCPAAGPGDPLPVTTPPSGQRPGSVLIYNLYTSAVDPNRQNTRISLTNAEASRPAIVHLFFVDGATCQVADSYMCLTANQTTSFLASDLDPNTTGYLVAVAVDQTGCPVNFNYLIGDEYVKFASGHAANLPAVAVRAIAGGLPACNQNSTTATLAFDGVGYSPLPHVLAASNLPSRGDGNDTMLVLNRIGGNLATGAASLGSVFGILYDDAEAAYSFSIASTACQVRASIGSASGFPRTTPRYETVVPSGRSGWMKLWIMGGAAAMSGAMINFNPNAATASGAFTQGRNLHVLTTTTSMTYTIPVFAPSC
jgi:predicted extracellular nuclease